MKPRIRLLYFLIFIGFTLLGGCKKNSEISNLPNPSPGQPSQCSLIVSTDIHIDGSPGPGIYTCNVGDTVNYQYFINTVGYCGMRIILNGQRMNQDGTFIMNGDSTLTVTYNFDWTNQIWNEANFSKFLEVGYIYSNDGTFTFLGLISKDKFNSDSIIDPFGYGDKFKSESIFNEFGTYGSEFSDYSAWNTMASHPPIIYIYNGFSLDPVAYLTTGYATPQVNTARLINWLQR